MKTKTYLISFFYCAYASFIIHFLSSGKILDFFVKYSEVGAYFAFIIISIYGLCSLLKDNVDLDSYIDEIEKNYALVLIFSLMLSHVLVFFHPLSIILYFLSPILGIHIYLISFILGIILASVGIILLKKYNKRMIFIPIGMLFVYGTYYMMSWHSFVQQRNIYVQTYAAALKNDISLNECGSNFSCLNSGFELSLLNKEKNTLPDDVNKRVNNYLKRFEEKVKDSYNVIVVFSYLDNLYTFIDDNYQPIGVYSKINKKMIVDYKTSIKITLKNELFYKRITGTSSFFWLLFMHSLIFFHYILRLKREKKRTEVKK